MKKADTFVVKLAMAALELNWVLQSLRDPAIQLPPYSAINQLTPESQDQQTLRMIYSNTALRPGARDIRAVALMSKTFDSEIKCKLHAESLDGNISFIALLYWWSNTRPSRSITVKGRKK